MKHFTAESLENLVLGRDEEYETFYSSYILKRLPVSFVTKYEKLYRMHDWYFDDLLVANSGKAIKEYSRNQEETVQLGFYSADERYVVYAYKNVTSLELSFEKTDDVSCISLNGLGTCRSNKFDIADKKALWHGYLFEGGTIELRFEKISIHQIRNPSPIKIRNL